MNDLAHIPALSEAEQRASLDVLMRSIALRSVSLTGEGIGEHVAFLKAQLMDWGFSVEVFPTTGHPILLAEIGPADAPRTLLSYGHYDVYPADREGEGWRTEPFTPVIEGDRIWGRGAGDNKGQHLALLNAIRIWRATRGELPVRIKFILEGDEETGSVPLPQFVAAHRARLAADLVCYSDGPMFPDDQPVLLCGVRGLLGLEFHATGAARNLHSGNFGGVAPNPTLDLIQLFAAMVDRDGRLAVPGTHNFDVPLSSTDRAALAALPLDREGVRASMGVAPTTGDDAIAFHERLMLRPAFNVSGFNAGYTGTGQKSIIFKEATAKADLRMAGGQNPDHVFAAIERFIAQQGFSNIRVRRLKAQPASRTALDHPVIPAIRTAVARGFGRAPLLVPSLGGTTPDYVFTQLLGLPSIVVPLAPYDENNHAPNESTKVSLYLAGIRFGLALIEGLG